MAWTEERVALLTEYWEKGHTASQIAELLGEGLSRNAVIGKAHRLGLPARPSPLKSRKTAAAKPRKTKKAPEAAPKAAPTTETPAMPASPTPQETARKEASARKVPAPQEASESARKSPAEPKAGPKDAPAGSPKAPVEATPRPAPRPARKRRNSKVTLLDLNDRICRWPIGHPDEADFHFCGKPVNPGFPYCPEHCLEAYQAQLPHRQGGTPHGQPHAQHNGHGSGTGTAGSHTAR